MITHALSDALPPSAAARELGISVQRVRQLIRDGRISAILTPLGRLVSAAEVDRLVTERAAIRAGDTLAAGPEGGCLSG